MVYISTTVFHGMPHHPRIPVSVQPGQDTATTSVRRATARMRTIALGGHVGTHIDALCHFIMRRQAYGGQEGGADAILRGGIQKLSVDTIAPIFRRGVLLDMRRHRFSRRLRDHAGASWTRPPKTSRSAPAM